MRLRRILSRIIGVAAKKLNRTSSHRSCHLLDPWRAAVIARSHRKSPPRRKSGAARPDPELSGNRSALVKRMWRAAEAQVREIENRLLQDSPEPLERERDARVLAVLAKTLRELSALEEIKPNKRTLAPADDDAVPRNMDELRRSLARKLEALVAGGTTAVPDES
jgi:hypothetical protein